MSSAFSELAQDYFDTVRERYNEFRSSAHENQTAVMRYYTFAGDEVRVGNVQLRAGSGTLLIQGDTLGPDGEKIPCDVIVQPPSAHLVLRLHTFRGVPEELAVKFKGPEDSDDGSD
jgi:hypothetical protein